MTILFILTLLCALIAFIGFRMVNKVGNYETIWGVMLFGGVFFTMVIPVIMVVFLVSLFL